MEVVRQAKPAVKKNLFGSNSLEKATKRGRSKKKKSSRKKHDKENEKCSTSPEPEMSDREVNDDEPECDRAEAEIVTLNNPADSNTAHVQHRLTSSHVSKNQTKVQPAPTLLQLQPQAIGYGENLKIVPAKIVPSNATVLPTQKPKTVSNNSSRKTTGSDVRVKDAVSQNSRSSKTYVASMTNMSRSQMNGARRDINNESLRWENECSNSEDEAERIKQYKINRRKRYLAAANKKYSDWIKTLHELENISGGHSSRQEKDFTHHSSKSAYAMAAQKEGLVSGLGPQISMHNSASQLMLNC